MSALEQLTTPITAAWLYELAGPDMWLYRWNANGNAMLQGKGPRCEMTPDEYWIYQRLCGKPVSMQEQTAEEDPLAGGTSGDISRDDLARILHSLHVTLTETKDRVDRAAGNLSVEDFGDALAGAGERLQRSLCCIEALECWNADQPRLLRVHVTVKAGELTLFNGEIEAESTSDAARLVLARPGVAKHLEDLKGRTVGIHTREVKRP